MAKKKAPTSKVKKNKVKIRFSYEDIIKEGNPLLREISEEVSLPIGKDIATLMKQMIDYVQSSQTIEEQVSRDLRASVGLSAVQVGVLRRLIYVRSLNHENIVIDEFALINPKITWKSKKMAFIDGGEGCLSVDKNVYEGNVTRHYSIKIEAIDYFTDRLIEIEAKGFTAVILQHEIDHLNGILFFDRINKMNPNYIPTDAVKI